jgi:hypothetical protein
MTTFTIKPSRPRNPLVAAARFRRAGKHAPLAGAARQAGRKALKSEMSSLDLPRNMRSKPPSL